MSMKTQTAGMKKLSELLSEDLGYIFGERESGPNGAKKEFLTKGRAFLSALAKDLCFSEYKLTKNNAGIAVSGKVTLMGLWSKENGLYIQIEQDLLYHSGILYRSIKHLKDYAGGRNNYIYLDEFKEADYPALVTKLLRYKESGYERKVA